LIERLADLSSSAQHSQQTKLTRPSILWRGGFDPCGGDERRWGTPSHALDRKMGQGFRPILKLQTVVEK
jgi:hypothetical protein